MKRIIFLLILSVTSFSCLVSQVAEQDTIVSSDTSKIKHSPRKAVIFSAILPGMGQVYNQKYWKVPIIYAAIGTLTYFIIDYNKKYNIYVNGYNDFKDEDPATNSFENIRQWERYSADPSYYLKSYRDFYRRWRDLDVLILAGVYVLNIIDANVDAHFFNFEIGDDLALDVKPFIFESFNNSKQVGISLNFKF
ncbi:MAG: hypothetical protein HC905_16175 [Bacteroidales bacterium]|nr:hypothetical protein [Bacteroidales bacterium]